MSTTTETPPAETKSKRTRRPRPQQQHTPDKQRKPWGAMTGRAVLYTLAAIMVTGVIVAPAILSSQELLNWARTGLGLAGWFAWLAFIALDVAAIYAIVMAVICSWRGETPGLFTPAVWLFAGSSAYANYSHGLAVKLDAPDAWWFFPLMSVLGPFLIEITLHKIRQWANAAKTLIAATAPQLTMPWYVHVMRWLLAPGLSWRAMRRWALTHPAGADLIKLRESVRRAKAVKAAAAPPAPPPPPPPASDPTPPPPPPPTREDMPPTPAPARPRQTRQTARTLHAVPAPRRNPAPAGPAALDDLVTRAKAAIGDGPIPANREQLRQLLGGGVPNALAGQALAQLRSELVAA